MNTSAHLYMLCDQALSDLIVRNLLTPRTFPNVTNP